MKTKRKMVNRLNGIRWYIFFFGSILFRYGNISRCYGKREMSESNEIEFRCLSEINRIFEWWMIDVFLFSFRSFRMVINSKCVFFPHSVCTHLFESRSINYSTWLDNTVWQDLHKVIQFTGKYFDSVQNVNFNKNMKNTRSERIKKKTNGMPDKFHKIHCHRNKWIKKMWCLQIYFYLTFLCYKHPCFGPIRKREREKKIHNL